MERGYRRVFQLIEEAGFKVTGKDVKKGKGDHIAVFAEYNGVAVRVISKPKRENDPKGISNFKADLKRVKREIDGETPRSAGPATNGHTPRGTGSIQILGRKASPG